MDDLRLLRQEIQELRAENRALRREVDQVRQQVPFPVPTAPASAPPQPPARVPRRVARRMLDEEGLSLQEFLRFKTPEYHGEEGDDPQYFLEETEKVVRRLSCSDARVIELVGMKMKNNAWDWFQRHIEDQLYGGNPPTWEIFREAVMDEFISPAERQNRAYQFEKLKQTYQMSVSEYAKEFTRLSKYAPRLVPDEAARVERFRAGMIPPLYNALLSGDFPTLTKIVDRAKLWETKNKEAWAERDRKRKMRSGQSSKGKSEGASVQVTYHNQNRGGQRRGQSQVTSVQSTPAATQGSVKPVCNVCGKGHNGQCRYSSIVCYHCGQAGHISRNCPQKGAQQPAAPAPQPAVQVERSAGRGAGRGRAQGQAPAQAQAQAPAPVGRGQGRVFAVNQQEAQTTNTAVTGIS